MNKLELDMNTIMASTVHDVKNALSLIDDQIRDVMTEVAQASPEGAAYLNRIRLETGRINNDLVHMLGLYRMHQNTFHPSFDDVPVEEVVQDASSRYTESLAALGIELNIQMDDRDCVWYMDPALIESVLANILTNSIRYTKDRVDLFVSERDGGLSIRVIDNGEGYPEKMLNFMGTEDEQGDVNFQTGSTGLGLFFCYQIAGLHRNGNRHGTIKLSNDPKGGASFELWLP
ncbi:HAMP domain-containing sensor histidine kinase [Saccharospirillum sp. HFRX-1]|uniref:sensor histidine kinase n=1 Tax=unclassified Saccharospirillum TaxID=2633430 RepID=UPI00372393DF